ncbi:MAG: methyltransferase domain-containing protein [Chloroflexi bacterium]|nr:methyltransferase domain-containing protein [Chloroflexota bacterium]
MTTAEQIAGLMAVSAQSSAIQITQTEYRLQLVDRWQIPHGARVLEVGCGQGDMTAVLAHAVGESGHVTAVDIADPDYGAPVTVGASAQHLLESPLGSRIDFHFRYDVLDPANTFAPDSFDYVVLAHCSWYFASIEQLDAVLQRVRPWARQLCFAEWDLQTQALEQTPHLLAILVQGQIEAFKANSEANIRSPFSRQRFKALLEETGWNVASESTMDTAALQDADWEISWCLESSLSEAETMDVSPKFKELLRSQVDVLRLSAQPRGNRPLPAYALKAERAEELT